jgi:hypothetical protein
MAFALHGPALTTRAFVAEINRIAGTLVEYVAIKHVVLERWQLQGDQSQSVQPKVYDVEINIVRPKPRTMRLFTVSGANLRALVCQFEEQFQQWMKVGA